MSRLIAVLSASLLGSMLVVAGATPAQATTVVRLSDSDALRFPTTARTFLSGDGTQVGSIALYKGVGTFGGVTIDAVVTVEAVTESATISNFDNPGSASSSLDNFQINLNTISGPGSATFRIAFFEANTYTGLNTGLPVVLQNVRVTSIDLDSSGTNGFQYSDFTGFQKYQMMSPTNVGVSPLTNPNRVRFIATKSGARSNVPEDQVLIKYDALSQFSVTFGNVTTSSSTNWFGLVFGAWPGTGKPVEYTNEFNSPPTSTNASLNVESATAARIPVSAFGSYQDADSNPFTQVRIETLPVSGSLEYFNGLTSTPVSAGQVISVADINAGALRFTGTASTSLAFRVHDGLDYSLASNTLSINVVNQGQTITFPNPGTRDTSTVFASGAFSSESPTLTVTLTSRTPGVCTVSGLDITPVAEGTCVIEATQPGTATIAAATPVTQTFPVSNKTPQTITFPNPGSKATGAAPFPAGATTNASGLTVTLTSYTPSVCTVSGGTISIVGPGVCRIRATQPGDATRAPAVPVDVEFTVTPGAPAVQTTAATSVTGSSATLNGTVNSFGAAATVTFCLSTSASVSGGALTCAANYPAAATPASVTSSSATAVTRAATGLTNGTTYYFQVIAASTSGTSYGNVMSFVASSITPPTAVTGSVTGVSSSGATLNGRASANGASTTTSFCLSSSAAVNSSGALSNCSQTRSASNISSNGSNQAISASVSSLSRGRTYYYQVTATNSAGTARGQIRRFVAGGPSATTLDATPVAQTTATLKGVVNGHSSSRQATVTFCLSATDAQSNGELTSCLQTVSATPGTVTSSNDTNVSAPVTGLDPGRTYYFQVIAKNSRGTNRGLVLPFTTTGAAPGATTLPATSVRDTSATLQGSVDPKSESTTVSFCWGETSTVSAGALQACTSVPATPSSVTGGDPVPVSVPLTGLAAGRTYFFQVVATSANGTSRGEVLPFTPGAPVAVTSAPRNIANNSAVLPGSFKIIGSDTTNVQVEICWGTSSTVLGGRLQNCAPLIVTPQTIETNTFVAVEASIANLVSGTTYFYQVRASKAFVQGNAFVGSSGELFTSTMSAPQTVTSVGTVQSFVYSAPPAATTDSATSVTVSEATIRGTVSANSSATTVSFCWSDSNADSDGDNVLDSCNSTVATPSAVSANSQSVSAALTGLQAAMTYYFQVIATNASGSAVGSILNFTTLGSTPDAVTLAASSVDSATATLNGTVRSNGTNTSVQFCWGTTDVDGNDDGRIDSCTVVSGTPATVLGTDTSTVAVSAAITGLTSSTTYYFQVIASQGTTETTDYGTVMSFVAVTSAVASAAPTAVTDTVTSVTGTSAILNGTVNGRGDSNGTTWFCLATSSSTVNGALTCDVLTPQTSLTGSSAETRTASVIDLDPGTTYYVQVVAQNTFNTSSTVYGNVQTFTTPAVAPTATTIAASVITRSSATLNGSVTAGGASRIVSFCLSTSNVLNGSGLATCVESGTATTSPVTGNVATPVSRGVTGLTPGVTYYFQVFVENGSGGFVHGSVLSFTTLTDSPTATTQAASAVSVTGATVNGSVYAGGASGTVSFCVATSETVTAGAMNACFGGSATTPAQAASPASVSGVTATPVSLALSSLTASTTYYFQVVITVGATATYGAVESFTTSAAPVVQPPAQPVTPAPVTPAPPGITVIDNPTRTLPSITTRGQLRLITTIATPVSDTVTVISQPATTLRVDPIIAALVSGQVRLTSTGGRLTASPVGSYTGRLVVPVIALVGNRESEVLVEIEVRPIAPTGATHRLTSFSQTRIVWQPAAASGLTYRVSVNDRQVCETILTSCLISATVGPKSTVAVTTLGGSGLASESVRAQFVRTAPTLATVVNFAENSPVLTEREKAKLRRIAAVASREGLTRLVIYGHTDSQGGLRNAASLSRARAVATRDYLAARLPDVSVVLGAEGLRRPVATNATERGRAANRRAEVLIGG